MYILKVNKTEYPIKPTKINPNVEIIKTSERSISGKMCVDYVTEKINLEIIWDLVTEEELNQIKRDFINNGDPVEISYLDKIQDKQDDPPNFFFDGINYTPVIINEALKWKDVSVIMAKE